jgi:hypothetical protein
VTGSGWECTNRRNYKHPASEEDILCSECNQVGEGICEDAHHLSCTVLGCDETKLVSRTMLIKAVDALQLYGHLISDLSSCRVNPSKWSMSFIDFFLVHRLQSKPLHVCHI